MLDYYLIVNINIYKGVLLKKTMEKGLNIFCWNRRLNLVYTSFIKHLSI